MQLIKIYIPNGLTVDYPGGTVDIPAATWVNAKPKWALDNPNLDLLAENAKAMGVRIIDQNEDEYDLSTMTQEEAETKARKLFAYLSRFA